MNELLPCPFCGWHKPKIHEYMPFFWIKCPACGGQSGNYRGEHKAFEAWNARQGLPRKHPENTWPHTKEFDEFVREGLSSKVYSEQPTQNLYGTLSCEGCGKPMPQTAVPADKAWCGNCSTKHPSKE